MKNIPNSYRLLMFLIFYIFILSAFHEVPHGGQSIAVGSIIGLLTAPLYGPLFLSHRCRIAGEELVRREGGVLAQVEKTVPGTKQLRELFAFPVLRIVGHFLIVLAPFTLVAYTFRPHKRAILLGWFTVILFWLVAGIIWDLLPLRKVKNRS